VAEYVTPPRVIRKEIPCLSREEARAFLRACEGDRMEALYILAISTGMRQGELLALRWANVDLDHGTAQIRGSLQRTKDGLQISEPKTSRSRRQVALNRSSVEALRRHLIRQNAERLYQGAKWLDSDLVFANQVGRGIEATNLVRKSFKPLLAKAGLRPMRFHDLRHTAATLLLQEGIHPKVVSDMLGHSQIAVTLDLYSHVTPTMHRQASDAMDAILKS
jgi:integrase